jgi:carbon-monoxide dehydrogenase medium subunit
MKDPIELFGGRIAGDYKSHFDARVADAILSKAGIDNAAQRHILVNVLKRAIQGAAA